MSAQDRSALELEKSQLKKDIDRTSKYIVKTNKKINATLDNYELIEQKIGKRKNLIENIESEIRLTDSVIVSTDLLIDSLKNDINILKTAHDNLVNKTYIRSLSKNSLLSLLSSTSLQDAFKRWLYSRQYNAFLKDKKQKLNDQIQVLNETLKSQMLVKFEKEKLHEDQQLQTKKLRTELTEKDQLIVQLEKEQAQLQIELIAKKKKKKVIDETIKRLIEEEIAKASRESEDATIDESDFASNRGRLNWPIPSSVISGRYGKQKHPTNKALEIENNGLDFKASNGSSVNAIYGGKVVGYTEIPGNGKMVIIRHGKYYTVYSRLTQVFVKHGELVKTGQAIAEVSEDFHLEIWYGKEKQDPAKWLKR
jgi:murein DD-endopeptidase MepM/ murein hydrolase activator NlpD